MKYKSIRQILIVLLTLVLGMGGVSPVPRLSPVQAAGSTPPLIRLQYATFDPLAGEPDIPSAQQSTALTAGPATFLVQFIGPVQEDWKAKVEATGARLYGYLPDYAFISRLDSTIVEQVRAMSFVRWVGPYHPAYRLASTLRPDNIANSQPVSITVQTLPDADLGSMATLVETWGGQLQGQAANTLAGYLRVTIPAGRLGDLAALDDVLWIEPYLEPKLNNDIGGGTIMRADTVRSSLGLYGSGQIVAVADTGLDTGNQSTLHSDVRGRVIKTYCLGRPSPCDWSDYVAHGTHVAGSVLGNGSLSGSTPSAHQYANSYAGVAPEAKLVFQSVASSQGSLSGIPMDRGDLMRTAYADGARIHTNSWGGPTGGTPQNPQYGGYVLTSRQIDQAAWDRKDMLILFAAGNEGTDADKNGVVDPDSVGQPGTAKNVITVGASENNRPGIANTWGSAYGAPVANDKKADNANGMAAFSSRGPTDDGRIKPDIVAPGAYIASMRTRRYVADDNMETSSANYAILQASGGTGATWQYATDAPHSLTHYWKATVNGAFNPNAITVLLAPVMDTRPVGGAFDLTFWHKYNLSGDNKLVLLLTDADLSPQFFLTLNLTGNQASYQPYLLTLPTSLCNQQNQCLDPSKLGVGFAIASASGSYNSEWWLDDLRVDGSGWGTLSSVGLTAPGSVVDEAYLMMGGTSMATPLTAGAAALVREWLTRIRGIANPSGALMKAVLLNGATDMSPGQYGTGGTREIPATRPNNVTGWGRVDLVESLNPPAPRQLWLKDNSTGLGTGGSAIYTVTIGPSQANVVPQFSLPIDEISGARVSQAPRLVMAQEETGREQSVQASQLTVDQLIQNGGFETTGSWAASDMARTNTQHHSGSWSMGSTAGVDGDVYQTVAFPSDAVTATLNYYWKNTDPDVGYDVLRAMIYDDILSDTLGLGPEHSADDTDWHGVALNFTNIITDVRGKTINVLFRVNQDGLLPDAAFYLDDVSLFVGRLGSVIPTLAIAPDTGPRGATFVVGGANFSPSTLVTVTLDGSFYRTVTSSGSGGFSFNLTPAGTITKGIHTVVAKDASGHIASDTFQIVPQVSVSVNPTSGSAGSVFTVTGNGFHGAGVINVTLDGSLHGTTTAATSGAFTYTLNTSAGITAGLHTVAASDNEASSAGTIFTIGSATTRQVSISPTAGPNGTPFTISGVNFTANSNVTLAVDGNTIKTVTANGNGSFVTTYAPSGLSTGQHTLVARDGVGQAQTTFNITSQTSEPFRVTLAWTDYPGEPSAAKALVNDLDLEVIAPDGTHSYGNQGLYASGQCLRDGKWDQCNNVEGIMIPNAQHGAYTIIVRGINVPHGPQPFALVASGNTLHETTPVPPSYKVYLPLIRR